MHKNKYERVRESIRDRIGQKYPVGAKIPSTVELHKVFGVSRETINRAVRDLTEEGILERRAGVGTFVTRPQSSTGNIGFLWPDEMGQLVKTPYMASILHAVEAHARRLDRHVLVASNVTSLKPVFTDQRNRVAGVAILFNRDPKLVEAYLDLGIPVVVIDPFVRTGGVPFVTSDEYSGVRDATLYLVKLGHQRIVFVTPDIPYECVPLEERILGYKAAMRQAGLKEMTHIHRADAQAPKRAVSDAFIEMIERMRPTACCCFNDGAASSVIQGCQEHGIAVPGDLSVVGFDDTPLAEQTSPALTTVHVPLEKIGQAAVRLLDGLVERADLTGEGVVFPTRLVERDSTKAPSHSSPLAGKEEDTELDIAATAEGCK